MNGEDCYLLGAGFSRAISEAMPTLAELRETVMRDLGVDQRTLRPFGNDLEQWMSFLSVDQPWLSYSEKLRNRALFSEASHSVATNIHHAEFRALQDPQPLWLERLVGTWFDSESTVISFNYDTLIERSAAQQRRVADWGDLYRIPLNIRSEISHGIYSGLAKYSQTTPELFKLHGSSNWAFSGLDAPPTDPVNITLSSGAWQPVEQTVAYKRGPQAARHADLEPLIIPPTGTKGTFYLNRALQAQWKDAFARLASASSFTIIGYSFPPSDLSARHFVANALPAEVPITIVDYSEDTVARIESFLGDSHPFTKHTGQNAVEKYVNQTCGDLVIWGAEHVDTHFVPHLRVNHQRHAEAETTWRGERYQYSEDVERVVCPVVDNLYPNLTSRAIGAPWQSNDLVNLKYAIA